MDGEAEGADGLSWDADVLPSWSSWTNLVPRLVHICTQPLSEGLRACTSGPANHPQSSASTTSRTQRVRHEGWRSAEGRLCMRCALMADEYRWVDAGCEIGQCLWPPCIAGAALLLSGRTGALTSTVSRWPSLPSNTSVNGTVSPSFTGWVRFMNMMW